MTKFFIVAIGLLLVNNELRINKLCCNYVEPCFCGTFIPTYPT